MEGGRFPLGTERKVSCGIVWIGVGDALGIAGRQAAFGGWGVWRRGSSSPPVGSQCPWNEEKTPHHSSPGPTFHSTCPRQLPAQVSGLALPPPGSPPAPLLPSPGREPLSGFSGCWRVTVCPPRGSERRAAGMAPVGHGQVSASGAAPGTGQALPRPLCRERVKSQAWPGPRSEQVAFQPLTTQACGRPAVDTGQGLGAGQIQTLTALCLRGFILKDGKTTAPP